MHKFWCFINDISQCTLQILKISSHCPSGYGNGTCLRWYVLVHIVSCLLIFLLFAGCQEPIMFGCQLSVVICWLFFAICQLSVNPLVRIRTMKCITKVTISHALRRLSFVFSLLPVYYLYRLKSLNKFNIIPTVVDVSCRNFNIVLLFCLLEKKFALILVEISPELQI